MYAAGSGLATIYSTSSTCGGSGTSANVVQVDHGNGVKSYYYHLGSFAISGSTWVDANTVIGYVGHTGYVDPCTFNHLHFEVRVNGTRVSPGQLKACIGSRLTTYPNELGKSDWNQVPLWSHVHSDGTSCSGGPPSSVLGDFNGDGKSDIAWYESNGSIAMFLGTPQGFALQQGWAQGIGPPVWAGTGSFPYSNGGGSQGSPSAPTSVHPTASHGSVAVSWSAPSLNGSAVSSYTVMASPGGKTVSVSATHATFAGLASGKYTFRVRAKNTVGFGPWSAWSSVVTVPATQTSQGSHGSSGGYWMLGSDGRVYAFGSAAQLGSASGRAVAIAPRRDGKGYWVTDALGVVSHFGAAGAHGGSPALRAGELVSTISATPSGNGYWLFTNRGRVFACGDAHFYGDMSRTVLNGPVVASVATPTGHGYFMVGSDGGVFSFGDAHFHGSTGAMHLNKPIVGISPTPNNHGYWLVASDGGVFAFSAPFRGSMGATSLNRPVNGLVAYGNGYLMVASDGGVFDFSNKAFVGSLASHPPTAPIISIAAT